jgi:hypothetical protein
VSIKDGASNLPQVSVGAIPLQAIATVLILVAVSLLEVLLEQLCEMLVQAEKALHALIPDRIPAIVMPPLLKNARELPAPREAV